MKVHRSRLGDPFQVTGRLTYVNFHDIRPLDTTALQIIYLRVAAAKK